MRQLRHSCFHLKPDNNTRASFIAHITLYALRFGHCLFSKAPITTEA
ncbi:MAG: hypothetical protein ACX93T_00720 [Bacteroidota bacterium]